MQNDANLTADYFGKIEILGMEVDGYVLSDGTPCLGEIGASKLLNFRTHSVLNKLVSNKGPKEIKQLILNNLTQSQTVLIKANCQQKHSYMKVYNAQNINIIARAYATAYLQNKLRKNQNHIGLHCATLRNALADVALEQVIFNACEFNPNKTIAKRTELAYTNALEQIQQCGFKCSVGNDIAIKKDITSFLKVPQSTLNSFLAKHSYEIKPIKLGRSAIQSIGSRSSRMNGYYLDDVVKIIFGMDSEVTAALKREIFGDLATFTKMDSKAEIAWREVLRKVFAGFEMKTNHPIGKYRYFVDYFIPELMLCLEENGYNCHRHYNQEEETKREQVITQKYALIRFHHKISLEVLVNAILKAKPGDIIKLYEIEPCFDFSKN